jgi:hypothetical protein
MSTVDTRDVSNAWTGWIGFAAIMMTLIGTITFFEGLVAIARDEYYVVSGKQVLVFDLTTWGWITLLWGIVLVLAGFSLLSGASWARWFTIVVGSLNFIVQLGFVGSSQYPLWALTALALTAVVLYALIVRWGEATQIA